MKLNEGSIYKDERGGDTLFEMDLVSSFLAKPFMMISQIGYDDTSFRVYRKSSGLKHIRCFSQISSSSLELGM